MGITSCCKWGINHLLLYVPETLLPNLLISCILLRREWSVSCWFYGPNEHQFSQVNIHLLMLHMYLVKERCARMIQSRLTWQAPLLSCWILTLVVPESLYPSDYRKGNLTQSSTIYKQDKQEAVTGRGKRKVMDTKSFMPLYCKVNWYISFQVRFVPSERQGMLLQNQKFAKHWLLPPTSPTIGRKMTQFIVHLTICSVGWCLQQSYQRLYAIHASWKQYFVTPITQIIPNNPEEINYCILNLWDTSCIQ